jgi:Cu/Zn superoxide dismutase
MTAHPGNTKEKAMMTRHTVLRTAFAAGLVSVAVAGCGMMQPEKKMDIFEATLTGAQEVPPNASAGRGTAEIQYDSSKSTVNWKVSYSGLSGPATGAHIHGPAAAGANAGILVPFSGAGTQPIQGQATITPTQFGDLAAGLWYVNIHTAQAPGGEIRGQLRRRQ